MMPIENIQEFTSVCGWKVLFAHSLHAGAQVAGPRNRWPDQGPSNPQVIFYDQGLWQISEAAGWSQVS